MHREGCCAGAVHGNVGGGGGEGGVRGSVGCTVVQRCSLVWGGGDCNLDFLISLTGILLSDVVLW